MRGATLAVCLLLVTAGCVVEDRGTETSTQPTPWKAENYVETPESPTTPSSKKYDVHVTEIEDIVHKQVNERRIERGLESLDRSEKLDAIARYKSWDMSQRDYFGHSGPNGTTHSIYRSNYNSSCNYIGQNIYAYSYNDDKKSTQKRLNNSEKIAHEAVNSLMNSTGHRENILDPDYELQGIGVFVDENGTVFLTQEFCG